MIYNSASPETKIRASPFCSQGRKLERKLVSTIVFHSYMELYFDANFLRGEDYLVARALEAVRR